MLLPIFACLLSCGPQVSVTVNAVAAPEARAHAHFAVVTRGPDGPGVEDDKAIAAAAARALSGAGFTPAGSPGDSDLTVVISWKIGKQQVRYRHVGSDATPQVSGAAPGRAGMPVGGTNNSAAFGFGQGPELLAMPFYPLTLTLKGVDRAAYSADPAAPPLWSATLDTEATTDDVALSTPEIMAAAMPYLGRTASKVRVRVGTADDSVKYVRGDIPALPTKKP